MATKKGKQGAVDMSIVRVVLGLFLSLTGLLGLFYPAEFGILLIALVLGVILLMHPSVHDFTEYAEGSSKPRKSAPRKRTKTVAARKKAVPKRTKKVSRAKKK